MNQVEFYPSSSVFMEVFNALRHVKDHLAWWGNGSRVKWKFDRILFSFAYHGNVNLRKKFDIRDDVKIMGDSGGFQTLTQGMSFEPLDVLRWEEEQCFMAVTLDIPTRGQEHKVHLRSMEANTKYLKLMEENREKKCILLNAMHGDTPDKFLEWCDAFATYDFDGYALGVTHTDFLFSMWSVGNLIEKYDPERIHMLGVAGFSELPSLLWLQQAYPKVQFSTDSSTWTMMGKNREMFLEGGVKLKMGTKQHFPTLKTLPCQCPFCRDEDARDILSRSSYGAVAIASHNLVKYIDYIHMIEALSDDFYLLDQFLKRFSKQGYGYLTATKYMTDNGVDAFFRKYIQSRTLGSFE